MIEKKYAELLVDYCLEIKKGQYLYVKSTVLAMPLLREVYREGLRRGANVVIDMDMEGQSKIFFDHADDDQLGFVSPNFSTAMHDFDAYLVIRAPYNLREDQNVNPGRRKIRAEKTNKLNDLYFSRTACGDMVRTLCQYPTQASAQEAGMSLEEYRDFVFGACNLLADDPKEEWLKVRAKQQTIVDYLNQCRKITYKNKKSEISFSVEGRIWINSDGRTNMPSGEVFTGPVEDSVEGEMFFDYPSIYRGVEVQGVRLKVQKGQVVEWCADKGGEILDQVFEIEGARRFGEVAVGTNYHIVRSTKNILFDEKIGGTIHMAVGQSYKQTGGKNQSTIHWDLIADMKDGGVIIADGIKIYENGQFIDEVILQKNGQTRKRNS